MKQEQLMDIWMVKCFNFFSNLLVQVYVKQNFSNSFVIFTLLDHCWKCFSNPLEGFYFSADDWGIFRPRVLRFTNSKTCHDLISYPGALSFPKTLSVRSELLYFLAKTYENAVKISGMFVCFEHELRPL